MTVLRLLAASAILSLPVGAWAAEKKDNAKLLVGTWEVTKLDSKKEVPVGSVIEFGKDGKAKITLKGDGKEESETATYKVEGDKLTLTLKLGDREEKKPPVTIKKLSDKELVFEDDRGVTFEFRRKK